MRTPPEKSPGAKSPGTKSPKTNSGEEHARIEVVPVANHLKRKAGTGPRRLPAERAARIKSALAEAAEAYRAALAEDLSALRTVLGEEPPRAEDDRTDWARGLYRIAHRIRGEAGMHGFDAVEAVAHLLCIEIERAPALAGKHARIARIQGEALLALQAAGIPGGDDPAAAELVEGLRAALERMR